MGARQPLELYRALPSAPTFNSARPLRKEFHIPVTPPCTHRRLSGRPLNCVLIFFNVLYMCFFVFSTVYHSRRHKSIKKRKYSPAKYKCFSLKPQNYYPVLHSKVYLPGERMYTRILSVFTILRRNSFLGQSNIYIIFVLC